MLYSQKNEGIAVLECEKEALSNAPGEKCFGKKCNYFLGFLKIHFIPNSGKEEATFYKFYMILNKVVKIFLPYYRNLTLALKKP